MKQLIFCALAIIIAMSSAAVAQFPQMERAKRRMDTSIKADKEREEADANAKTPAYPPAKMNVDVQMVLAEKEYKTFAEAKPNAISRVNDGDPLWMYLKFNGKLERYVARTKSENGDDRYLLYLEIGPQGDVTAKNHYTLQFTKEDLALTELKIDLATGLPGHNRSAPVFIQYVNAAHPGLWNNEVRIGNIAAFPRGPNEYLAKTPLLNDFSKGFTKYPKMVPDFYSGVLRGSVDLTKVPLPGKFDDAALRAQLSARLAAENIKPTNIWFAGDEWSEYSELPTSVSQYRSVTAAYTYLRDGACLYGTAQITETLDPVENRFGAPSIEITKDLKTACQ